MTGQGPSEEELLERLRLSDSDEGRRLFLEALLTPYLDRIARWALRISAQRDDAAAIAQEGLLAVCSHIDQFRGECRFSTWLYTIVRNQGLKRAERSATGAEVSLDDAPALRSEAPGPDDSIDRQEEIEQFRRLIDTVLTPLEARVFLGHFGEGTPLAVLDRELGLTNRSGARAYLIAAKRKLRRRMRLLNRRPPAPGRLGARDLAGAKGGHDD